MKKFITATVVLTLTVSALFSLSSQATVRKGGVTSAGGEDKKAQYPCVFKYEDYLKQTSSFGAPNVNTDDLAVYCMGALDENQLLCISGVFKNGESADRAVSQCLK